MKTANTVVHRTNSKSAVSRGCVRRLSAVKGLLFVFVVAGFSLANEVFRDVVTRRTSHPGPVPLSSTSVPSEAEASVPRQQPRETIDSPGPQERRALEEAEDLFDQLNLTLSSADGQRRCKHLFLVGGRCLHCTLGKLGEKLHLSDGAKPVCIGLLRRNCSVLSFGISNDFSFDLAMEDLGCTVHAFDPTMGVVGFRRSAGVHFHGVGLGAGDDLDSPFPVASLDTVLQHTFGARGVVDYVKLDVESAEWGALEQQLASSGALLRVRQLTVEFHLWQWRPRLHAATGMQPERRDARVTSQNARRFLAVLAALKAAGFRLVHTAPYGRCQRYGRGCLPFIFETLWLNDLPRGEDVP